MRLEQVNVTMPLDGINQIVCDCPSHELGMAVKAWLGPILSNLKGFPMKTWMKVVLGVFVGMSALLGLVFWLTGGIAKTADDFFAAVQNDDMDAA